MMNKRRPLWVTIAFGFGLLLAFGFLWIVAKSPPEEIKGFGERMLYILTALKKDESYLIKYPTALLALISLPIAAVLWLFRNHDIVMKLDLDMYQEAVRNIHNQDASTGLRKVAFVTLMELREKSAWSEKIRENVFPGANLSNLDLYKAKLQKMNLTKTTLTEATLTEAYLHEAMLTKAKLSEANLTEATLTGANLTGAYLHKAILTRAYLHKAILMRTILTEANLTEANLTEAILIANLTEARLIRANLTEARLIRANLTGARLIRANLTGAILTGARLTEATLTGAKLYDTHLTNAILEKTDLLNAILEGAYYYKDGKKNPVTKKWLRERGAVNVDSVRGIPEE